MTATERRAAVSLASIFSMRMLGLFMILPVFSLYAEHFEGATPLLTGLAVGIYGLTQAILQIPFGMASDRFGRKRVIAFGLLIFGLGSVVAALADSINGVILGRALQGSGAVAAAVLALAADLTREEHRTKAMAIIGMSIGGSFALALVAGPVLNSLIGVPGIFWLTSVLALVGIGVLYLLVPTPAHSRRHRDAQLVPGQIKQVLADRQLLRLDAGILILHTLLTATFVVLPLALRDNAGLAQASHWMMYLPVLGLSVLAMVPLIIYAERRRKLKIAFRGAILLLAAGQAGLAMFHQTWQGIAVTLFVFFAAFNYLEASLPSLISRLAPPDKKGTAMGAYSSSQFFGAFLGGLLGGALYGANGIGAVFWTGAGLSVLWWLMTAGMSTPRHLASLVVGLRGVNQASAERIAAELQAVAGVAEAVVIVEDASAYLKIDKRTLDQRALNRVLARAVA